jgi:small subunit ribosomal protein S6
MPANVYECMFLLDTNKVAGDTGAVQKQLHGILERNQAEVLASRPWDDRRLSYPIKGHKKGLYYLTYFRTDGKNLDTIERDFALNETILRTLILHVDPKLAEHLLALAAEPGPVAYQTVREAPPDEEAALRGEGRGEGREGGRDGGRDGDGDRGGPPRGPRGPRRPADEKEE